MLRARLVLPLALFVDLEGCTFFEVFEFRELEKFFVIFLRRKLTLGFKDVGSNAICNVKVFFLNA